MGNGVGDDSLLEFYVYETIEQLVQLENIALQSEKNHSIKNQVNEVFRLVHTMKGSSAVMNFINIVELTHSLEDIFYFIRENNPAGVDYSALTDLVLKSIDFIKKEIAFIQCGEKADTDVSKLVTMVKEFLSFISDNHTVSNALVNKSIVNKSTDKEYIVKESAIKDSSIKENTLPIQLNIKSDVQDSEQQFKAIIYFEEGCEMENVRAFNIIYNLKNSIQIINYFPEEINQKPETAEYIRKNGFEINFISEYRYEELETILSQTLFIREVRLYVIGQYQNQSVAEETKTKEDSLSSINTKQNMISVNITKMDRLMDLVGELVITQAMVIQNPELEGLALNGFLKASRQLQLVTNDIQDAVMSLRMVSLSMIFQKMNRIVRDMSKKLNKEIRLEVIGENTEVDKNIIEHLSDPLLHLVRNAADHGIEEAQVRSKAGKSPTGTITLEARNDGGDVRIIVKDDGKGLNKDKILEKARQQGLLNRPENEYSDKEIYSMIFRPGFSTKESITEFSGRGVGMDVVNKNIDEIGGTIQIESEEGSFTAVIIRIPLTLAIMEGMKIRVGKAIYILPITAVRESFRITNQGIILDEASKKEMIMIRGNCYPILRLYQYFNIPSSYTTLTDGIVVLVEYDSKSICLFADELIGVQQVVIKALPDYIRKRKDISSCTVLGNGNVSLIIDIPGLMEQY